MSINWRLSTLQLTPSASNTLPVKKDLHAPAWLHNNYAFLISDAVQRCGQYNVTTAQCSSEMLAGLTWTHPMTALALGIEMGSSLPYFSPDLSLSFSGRYQAVSSNDISGLSPSFHFLSTFISYLQCFWLVYWLLHLFFLDCSTVLLLPVLH